MPINNPERNPDNPQTSEADIQQGKLKDDIVACMRVGQELPDEYIQKATPKTLQEALKQGLVECIEKGQWLSKKYTEHADKETWSSIKVNHQAEIKLGFALRIKRGEDFPSELLDLATKDTWNYIKSNHQENIRQGIITYAARRQGILQLYLKLASEDTLQSAVKESVLKGLANGVPTTDRFLNLLSEKNVAEMRGNNQKDIKDCITLSAEKGRVVSEKYLELLTGDNLQQALAGWLPARIAQGQGIPKKFQDSVSEEVLTKIRESHQKEIEQGIGRCMWKGKDIPQYLKDLATDATMQSGLRSGLVTYISKGKEIPEFYLKLASEVTIQSSFKDGIVQLINSGTAIPVSYVAKVGGPEAMQSAIQSGLVEEFVYHAKLGTSVNLAKLNRASNEIIRKEHQGALQQVLADCMKKNVDIPLDYIRLATEQTKQAAFQEAWTELSKQFKDYGGIRRQYLDMVTDDEMLESLVEQIFFESLEQGIDLDPRIMGRFLSQESYTPSILVKAVEGGVHLPGVHHGHRLDKALSLFENESLLRNAASRLTASFFNSPKEVESEIQELLSKKDIDWIRKLVFDRTLLSVGVKIHTHNKDLSLALKKSGGFVAHGKDTCFVANPVPNTSVVEIALEALKRKVGNLDEEAFLQTCVPHRLSNEYCGIATIAFLLTKTNNVKYNSDVLKHNQDRSGLTIYDAGGRLEVKFYVPKAVKDNERKVTFNGRTDIVLCTTIDDVKNAHTLLSLLVHGSYDPQELRFKALGQQFVAEFKTMLERHGHTDWLRRNFIKANIDDVGSMLLTIAEHREAVSKTITQYNAGIELYSQEMKTRDENEAQAEEIRRQLESMKKKIDDSLWFDIRNLVERYKNRLYPDGMYIHALSGEYYG